MAQCAQRINAILQFPQSRNAIGAGTGNVIMTAPPSCHWLPSRTKFDGIEVVADDLASASDIAGDPAGLPTDVFWLAISPRYLKAAGVGINLLWV